MDGANAEELLVLVVAPVGWLDNGENRVSEYEEVVADVVCGVSLEKLLGAFSPNLRKEKSEATPDIADGCVELDEPFCPTAPVCCCCCELLFW